jgi:hypothetical protein
VKITLDDIRAGRAKLDEHGHVHVPKARGPRAPRLPRTPPESEVNAPLQPRVAQMVEFPLFTKSEANGRDHHMAKASRVARQRKAVARVLETYFKPPRAFPAVIVLTRLAPRDLDVGDNLGNALKAVRDEVAAFLGLDDGSPLLTWRYEQARPTRCRYAVRIQIEVGAPC